MDMAAGVFVRHPPPIAGRDDGRAGVAVVGAVGGEHLVAAGVQARQPDGVLVGVRAAVGEEHLVHTVRRQRRDPLGRLAASQIRGGRSDGRQARGLVGDRGRDHRMLVADVHIDHLAGEIQVLPARVVPHPAAAPAREHHRVQRGLRRPGVEHMAAVEFVGARVQVDAHGGHAVTFVAVMACRSCGMTVSP